MKLGETLYARWLIQGEPPVTTGTALIVREIRKHKGTRRKNKWGEWETFGKGSRVLVESPVGFKYWLDPDALVEAP